MDALTAEKLLAFARNMVQAELTSPSAVEKPRDLPNLPHGGAFVTLKNRGRLRGCMGTFSPRETLLETIECAARLAADDPRFRNYPVTPEEMDDIRIEISVLSSPEPTDRPEALEVGRHGIWIRRGLASGCFLPQVATERNWSVEQFLSNCCAMKAGLAPDAWKDPETEVLLFAAEIIAERD
ncbi:MAG: AmmeMemoRadiSam system protein A [Planctomycetota bacterium]